MIEFAHPAFLFLLLGVPLVIRWWLRRRRGALRFSATGAFAALPPGRSHVARWGGAALQGAALVLLVGALAGPRWPDVHTRIATEGIAIQMIVDVSGSMAEPDFDWDGKPISRLEAAKRAFHLFVAGGEGPKGEVLEGRPNDLIGLVTFATWPDTPCPLTLSHSVLLHMLEGQQPRSVPTEGRTNIGDAIAWGLHRLESARSSRKVMVLLSDGEHNIPPPALTPRQAAQLAANQHVPIYTIDAGGEAAGTEVLPGQEGATPAEIRAAGQKALRAVAEMTGGKYFQARDTATLVAVCRDIDRLERQEIQSFIYRRYYESHQWLGLAALLFLVTGFVLEKSWWQRVP
jgi:Ca-activated chloride channel family protein